MSEPNQHRCLVLLPPEPRFTSLFEEILVPALTKAGLSAHLIQPQSPIPDNRLLHHILQAHTVLADLSETSAGLWFALGYAKALGKSLCLLSSASKPLDLKNPPSLEVIVYPVIALPSDYLELQQNIIHHLNRFLPHPSDVAFSTPDEQDTTPLIPPSEYIHIPESTSTAEPAHTHDLVSYEVLALTILDTKATTFGLSPRDLGLEMRDNEAAHLTSHAMNALKRRGFIERRPVRVMEGTEHFLSENLFITSLGEQWLTRSGRRPTHPNNRRSTHASSAPV